MRTETKLRQAVQELINSENKDLIIEELTNLVIELRATSWRKESKLNSFSHLNEKWLNKNASAGNPPSIDTGFLALEKKIGGFHKGELIAVGGRPGMGKTTFTMQLVSDLFKFKNKLIWFSLDLTADQIYARYISMLSSIPSHKLLNFDLSKTERKIFDKLSPLISSSSILIDDMTQNIFDMMNVCKKQKEENGLDIIVIDFLELVSMSDSVKIGSSKTISTICQELNLFAKKQNILVVVITQLNKSVDIRGGDKRPSLIDLGTASSLEYFASKVLFIYRPGFYDITVDEEGEDISDLMEVIVSKNKIGPVFYSDLIVNRNFASLSEK
ncbi:MAG: replicative DNA helicase [Saprospiraceae bacterium]|jgi:replicative DNA helicase